MAKLSVVIPVYNVADYLDKCLWSVTNQTFKELEIIIVNDGSTDNSLSVAQRYAAIDKRITVINQPNQGVSAARENGLLASSAEYIHFLDGDDFLELNCYEVMWSKAAAADADIAFMKFWFQDGENLTESKTYEKTDKLSLLKRMWETSEYYSVWHYIHKRSLYVNNIIFERGLSIGEDAYMTTQLLYYASKIISIDIPFYHYIMRATSVLNSTISDKKAIDILRYSKLIHNFMHDKPEYSQLKKNLYCADTIALCTTLRARYFENCSDKCREVVKMRQEYPELHKVTKTSNLRKLISAFACNSSLGRAYAQYYIWKKKI